VSGYQQDDRVEAVARTLGAYIGEYDELSDIGRQAWRNKAALFITAADLVDPLRAVGVDDRIEAGEWRVGEHYGIHVYEGDRPVATFHNSRDAYAAVDAHNAAAVGVDDDKPGAKTREALVAELVSVRLALQRIRADVDTVNRNHVQTRGTLTRLDDAYRHGVEDGIKEAIDRIAAHLPETP
jgi:hypothetical protein